MSRIPEYIYGGTIPFKWINSGVSMSPTIEIYNGSEQLVGSDSMVDSGNGHYYYWWATTSGTHGEGYYVAKMFGTTGGKPFVRSAKVKLIGGGVD